MKNTAYASLAIKVAAFYFMAVGVGQNVHAQSEVRFRLVHDTIVVISMTAGQDGPYDFVLDTGADTTIVDSSLASKLSLAPLGHIQQTTLAGGQSLPVCSLASLGVGTAQVENLPVMVQDLAELRKLDSHIVGIAGQDFLSHFNYLLDYRRHTLLIEQGDEIQTGLDGERVAMQRSGSRMLVASEAQSTDRASLRLMLDSGATALVLVHSASQALKLPVQNSGLETTSSGQARLQVGRVHALTVGSQELHDIPAALTADDPGQRIGDGLLPTALFHTVYVNNRAGFVVFNARMKKN